MSSPSRLHVLREAVREFGPLRWVVFASAVLPTSGLLLLLANLPALASAGIATPLGHAAAAVVIAFATGALLLPPSFSAFAAGYLFGPWAGVAVAVPAIAVGGVFGSRVVWPLVGAPLHTFMQGRPRLEGVRTFCAVPSPRVVLHVAIVRASARVPFSVVNLLLWGAGVGSRAVLLGTLCAAAPLAVAAALLGAAFAAWRADGGWPSPSFTTAFATAAFVAAAVAVGARRRFTPAA